MNNNTFNILVVDDDHSMAKTLMDNFRIKGYNTDVAHYMQKPYDIDQLLVTIHRAIEKQEADKVVRSSEKRYRTLFESLPLGLYRTTPDGQNQPDQTKFVQRRFLWQNSSNRPTA